MPYSYEIDPWRRRVTSRWWGVTGDEELVEFYERLRRDPAFDPTYAELGDLRAIERLETAPVTVELVARLRVFASGVRRAAVAGSDVAAAIAQRFAEAAAEHAHEFAVFRDEREADAWLRAPAASRPGAGHRRHSGRPLSLARGGPAL